MSTPRIFAAGFRPMFLAAGLAGVALIPAWIGAWVFGLPLATAWPPTLWHAHEMLYGFTAAAIAGFLLTAVPSWTGQRGFAGTPLVVLAALWIAGRVLVASSAHFPAALVLAVDVAFVPALIVLVAPPLVRERNRNTPLLGVLLLLAAGNAAFHAALWRGDPVLAQRLLLPAIDVVLVLVTVIGGRILPAFTANALRGTPRAAPPRAWKGSTATAVALMAAIVAVDAVAPGSRLAGALAGAAALVQLARLAQWRGERTLHAPILWVLHLGYAFLPLGLALKCAALLGGWAFGAFWLHALTIGSMALMVMAVMTRASLGHTGRPLQVRPAVALAYVLLAIAALLRVFGLAWLPLPYVDVLFISAAFWTSAFALFLWNYLPILWGPRADGRPG